LKKKSPATSLAEYRGGIAKVRAFVTEAHAKGVNSAAIARCYDHAVLIAYRTFEAFVLDICIARINVDPSAFYDTVGVNFGVHITANQCAFLLVGDGYFDFRGHGGLVDVVRKVSGAESAMVAATKVAANRVAFEILAGLRNYVAHQSRQSHRAALPAMKKWEPARSNLGFAGVWLRTGPGGQTRLERLLIALDQFCESLANAV
jgi:hypothetical protein